MLGELEGSEYSWWTTPPVGWAGQSPRRRGSTCGPTWVSYVMLCYVMFQVRPHLGEGEGEVKGDNEVEGEGVSVSV